MSLFTTATIGFHKSTALGFSAANTCGCIRQPYEASGNGYSHVDAGSHGQGAGAGAGAKRTYGAALGQVAKRAAAAMRERGFQSLVSGARTLRKYACDADAIRETVHMSVKLRRKATVLGIEPHEIRAK
eukprot:6191042-Pleurochrysis_carterae.AAC.1